MIKTHNQKRLRYIASTYREEILDFALTKIDENAESQLQCVEPIAKCLTIRFHQ